MNFKIVLTVLSAIACLSLVLGCSDEQHQGATLAPASQTPPEQVLPANDEVEFPAEQTSLAVGGNQASEPLDALAQEPEVEFKTIEDALQAFMESYGSGKSKAKQYMVSNPQAAVPVLIQALAKLGGITSNPVEAMEVSSVLVEIGDKALPTLEGKKAQIDQFLRAESYQRASDSAAHRVVYDPPPVVHELMSIGASIEWVIKEIKNKKD